jgi:hypothetical protein
LPEFVINDSDLAGTVKRLAELLSQRDDLLSNGYAPMQIAVNENNMPHATELTTEAVKMSPRTLILRHKAIKIRIEWRLLHFARGR